MYAPQPHAADAGWCNIITAAEESKHYAPATPAALEDPYGGRICRYRNTVHCGDRLGLHTLHPHTLSTHTTQLFVWQPVIGPVRHTSSHWITQRIGHRLPLLKHTMRYLQPCRSPQGRTGNCYCGHGARTHLSRRLRTLQAFPARQGR